jgi:hypothetical protein
MICEIQWNSLPIEAWEERFSQISRSTILQSYDYALATSKLNRQRARWGLILMSGKEAGLVQILEAGVFKNLFHAVILDRGPLWFDGFGGAAHIKLFFDEINRQFPQRWGRKRRFLPEVQQGPAAEQILKQTGLQRVADQEPYQTLWWDTQMDEHQTRENLRPNWRGSLEKAEKSGVNIEWDSTGLLYPWLRNLYAQDKKVRGYSGASPQLLDNLAIIRPENPPMIIGKATYEGRNIAGILLLKHGQSATYQVGWSSDEGRKYCAHHLLLWQARFVLQQQGIKQLDLGGINDDTAAGIKKFKTGTGAQVCTLTGHYS